ncbi:crossover junction endodeoxyribonuclease RuvC [Alicyclobacillus dauci]|uniref:Crossover junction endodeoxyribonuclease RuvC n=1 Tax=Alicyclobacillus dauci TaxID=1475485 RepID=A0ABY6YZA2_9BACL|nr:crossover junction endodeoxyribonuclease RuvC [Alicyclobacillus dauci]WAH35030.1 crossover junction endodeoxyribonuclease RuvC [Alicyclobacillus dauci]
MKILGVDHATHHAGIALFESDWMNNDTDLAFVTFSAIDLSKCDESPMSAMFQIVKLWIFDHRPDVVALEKPMALRNGDVARKLIEVYAACKLAAEQSNVSVMELAPQLGKLHTIGHAGAEKEDVARALQARFDLDYDSIAIPVYYKDKKRKGQVRERLYDVSDACALCVAAAEIKAREVAG